MLTAIALSEVVSVFSKPLPCARVGQQESLETIVAKRNADRAKLLNIVYPALLADPAAAFTSGAATEAHD